MGQLPSPLVSAHIRAEKRLRDITTGAVERIWRSLPGYDRHNADQWLSGVVPVVLGAQRQSVALTEAFLARSLKRQPLGVDPDELIGAAVRNGTPPAEVYHRPFVTVWAALGAGKQFQDAVHAGLARSAATAAMDVQLSMRATANAVQEADDGIFGYQRVADGAACAFCSEVDGAYVKNADAMPLHNHCGCGLEPLPVPHVGAKFLPDGTQIRASQYGPYINTPLPSGVAVHQHGELGPILADSAHDFTTASQALS